MKISPVLSLTLLSQGLGKNLLVETETKPAYRYNYDSKTEDKTEYGVDYLDYDLCLKCGKETIWNERTKKCLSPFKSGRPPSDPIFTHCFGSNNNPVISTTKKQPVDKSVKAKPRLLT